MNYIIAFDLETDRTAVDFLRFGIRTNPLPQITQIAGVCHFDTKTSVFNTAVPKVFEGKNDVPSSVWMSSEAIMLECFFEWILLHAEKAKKANQKLYMIAHNGISFDLPFMEERIIDIIENFAVRREIFQNLISRDIWKNVVWVDSLSMAYKFYPNHKPNYKLTSLYQTITNEELKDAHNALPDAQAVSKLFCSFPVQDAFPGRLAAWVEDFYIGWNCKSYTGDDNHVDCDWKSARDNCNDFRTIKANAGSVRFRVNNFGEEVARAINRNQQFMNIKNPIVVVSDNDNEPSAKRRRV